MAEERQENEMPLLDQFKQQMLKAWQPVPSLTKTIIMFFILSSIFLGLGIPMIVLSSRIQEYSVRYDTLCSISSTSNCSVNLEISSEMDGPVFVYYQLNGYYQNHRLYANSISEEQMKGKEISMASAQSSCSPIVKNIDLGVNVSITGLALDPQGIANPCGIIAATIFNDSFVMQLGGQNISIADTGIAWPSDLKRFVIPNATSRNSMWYDITQERFMNWVRISSMPDFRKLWGRIDRSLPIGNYSIQITNQFDVSPFNGAKYFVVTQSNFFGSKNDFLSISYIVVGGLCLVIGIAFLVKKIMKNKSKSE